MDPILSAIDNALKEKGLSDAAASKLAVGHPSLIKNFRMERKGEKRYNVAALEKLADILDLEFYFGPRREVTTTGFAEATAAAFLRAGAPEAVTNVFAKGYLPFPWHDLAREAAPPPVVLSLAWLEAHGLAPDHLRFATIPEPGPTLALIDSTSARGAGLAMWVWQELDDEGKPRLRIEWAARDSDDAMIVLLDGDAHRAFEMAPAQVRTLRFLGRAVWTARLEQVK